MIVSVIYPGYIRSEMNDRIEHELKCTVDTETAVRSMGRSHRETPHQSLCPGLAVGTDRSRPTHPATDSDFSETLKYVVTSVLNGWRGFRGFGWPAD